MFSYIAHMITIRSSLLCFLIIASLTSIQGQVFTPIRINVGGSNFTDLSTGHKWQEDTSFVVGNKGKQVKLCTNISVAITNLTTAAAPRNVYCSYRFFRKNIDVRPYSFRVPVLNTTVASNFYRVRLHFAELAFSEPNTRVMDVYVDGVLVRDNLDVAALVGKNAAYVYTVPHAFPINDGALNVGLVPSKQNPFLSGIEVLPTQPPQALYRINCGSSTQVTDSNNFVWSADQFFINSGKSYNTCGSVTNNVYCTSRYFRTINGSPFRYDIPVPVSSATYTIRLHFSEQFHNKAGLREFDVFVEGFQVIDNLDIVRDARGKNVPYIVSKNIFVTDGFITIDFVAGLNDPQINAIEVFRFGTSNASPVPTTTPIATPVKAPVASPVKAPVATPISAPVTTPVRPPFTKFPTAAPVALPPHAQPVPVPPTGSFKDIYINCGGPLYLEASGLRYWAADNFFFGGSTYSISSIPIDNTADDPIYQSERSGDFSYEIPVPVGTYEISIHLAEIFFTNPKQRIFNITIENTQYGNVDIIALAGAGKRAVTIGDTMVVDDGSVSISVSRGVDQPKINGIEIKRSVPHVAHSVSNGPYHAVDSLNIGSATVNVDGSESHTHGIDKILNQWIWTKGNQVLARGEVASFSLPVGTHDIALTVIDDGGNEATDSTTVTVDAFGFPFISTLTPASGGIAGGQVVTITGSGFTYPASQTIVHFGIEQFTGTEIQILSSTTITVVSPLVPIVVPVQVTVETPLGISDGAMFTYTSSTPISFSSTKLLDFAEPTVAKFGPDGKLYVGTLKGTLGKITLNADFTAVTSMVSAVVQPNRAILGITFDPMDAGNLNPPIYISSSFLFHGEKLSSSGGSINGKISRITGANLDVVVDIVTGLPVCDNDHAVNQIEFGNTGKLYINIGSNTNGGVPGKLSGTAQLKENYFSAATIVADLKNPLFDGFIEYDAPDDGSPINFFGVSIFAPGQRNPFGLVIHSNGYMYATDNGPNSGYGKMKVGCGPSDLLDDQEREDKLNRLVQGNYYGHPNMKRAVRDNDSRQCVWRNPTEPTSANYEAPLSVELSSATGLIEYRADHFNRQLRGNLLHIKYKSSVLRTVLSPDGLSVNTLSMPGISLVGRNGLDLAQAPNGNLIEVRYLNSSLWVDVPIEPPTTSLIVNSVFPSRGSQVGGTRLRIYGRNFGVSPAVTIGLSNCPIVGVPSASYIECTLPGGTGLQSVKVTSGAASYTFQKGYRYIVG